MMMLQMAMSGGVGVTQAAKEVARETGGNPETIRRDWYELSKWGRQFFNLDDPSSMLIDSLAKITGEMMACDMEIQNAQVPRIPLWEDTKEGR
jgi:hypothetical protein